MTKNEIAKAKCSFGSLFLYVNETCQFNWCCFYALVYIHSTQSMLNILFVYSSSLSFCLRVCVCENVIYIFHFVMCNVSLSLCVLCSQYFVWCHNPLPIVRNFRIILLHIFFFAVTESPFPFCPYLVVSFSHIRAMHSHFS